MDRFISLLALFILIPLLNGCNNSYLTKNNLTPDQCRTDLLNTNKSLENDRSMQIDLPENSFANGDVKHVITQEEFKRIKRLFEKRYTGGCGAGGNSLAIYKKHLRAYAEVHNFLIYKERDITERYEKELARPINAKGNRVIITGPGKIDRPLLAFSLPVKDELSGFPDPTAIFLHAIDDRYTVHDTFLYKDDIRDLSVRGRIIIFGDGSLYYKVTSSASKAYNIMPTLYRKYKVPSYRDLVRNELRKRANVRLDTPWNELSSEELKKIESVGYLTRDEKDEIYKFQKLLTYTQTKHMYATEIADHDIYKKIISIAHEQVGAYDRSWAKERELRRKEQGAGWGAAFASAAMSVANDTKQSLDYYEHARETEQKNFNRAYNAQKSSSSKDSYARSKSTNTRYAASSKQYSNQSSKKERELNRQPKNQSSGNHADQIKQGSFTVQAGAVESNHKVSSKAYERNTKEDTYKPGGVRNELQSDRKSDCLDAKLFLRKGWGSESETTGYILLGKAQAGSHLDGICIKTIDEQPEVHEFRCSDGTWTYVGRQLVNNQGKGCIHGGSLTRY